VTGIVHIVLARKPIEGTIAENCLQWGCGALWIDGCRVGISPEDKGGFRDGDYSHQNDSRSSWECKENGEAYRKDKHLLGRWPANLILGGEEVVEGFPQTTTNSIGTALCKGYTEKKNKQGNAYGEFQQRIYKSDYFDSGSASRFFFNYSEQESDE